MNFKFLQISLWLRGLANLFWLEYERAYSNSQLQPNFSFAKPRKKFFSIMRSFEVKDFY